MPKKKNNQTTGKPSKDTSFPYNFATPDYLDVSTKPIDVEKPINGFDYLNALVRIPEVQKDLEVIRKDPDNKKKELELINKYWGIDRFFPVLLQNPNAFYKHNKYYHNSGAIHVFSKWEFGFTNGDFHFPGSISEYRDGRHVILAVDVTKKKQNIMNEFEELLNRTEDDYGIPRDTTKDKDTGKNIWGIYDLRDKGVKWSVIASRIFGKHSRDNKRQVIRYYNKAKKIINTVRQEVNEAIIANTKRKENDNKFKEMLSSRIEESKKERTISIGELLLQGIPKKTKRK